MVAQGVQIASQCVPKASQGVPDVRGILRFYNFICSWDPPDNLFETVEKWCISRAFLSVTIHFSFSYFSVVICIWVMKGTESTYNRLDYFDIYFSINPR